MVIGGSFGMGRGWNSQLRVPLRVAPAGRRPAVGLTRGRMTDPSRGCDLHLHCEARQGARGWPPAQGAVADHQPLIVAVGDQDQGAPRDRRDRATGRFTVDLVRQRPASPVPPRGSGRHERQRKAPDRHAPVNTAPRRAGRRIGKDRAAIARAETAKDRLTRSGPYQTRESVNAPPLIPARAGMSGKVRVRRNPHQQLPSWSPVNRAHRLEAFSSPSSTWTFHLSSRWPQRAELGEGLRGAVEVVDDDEALDHQAAHQDAAKSRGPAPGRWL